MKHVPLVELLLLHGYYASGLCPDFAIEPSEETERILRSHRCVYTVLAHGLRVLAAFDDAGKPFLPLPVDAVLRFHLTLGNPDFGLFTDLKGLEPGAAPVFSNASTPAVPPGALKLEAADPARSLPRGVFAAVDIHLSAKISTGFWQPAAFTVAFVPRKIRWAYYLITDKPPEATEEAIVDASPTGTADVVSFSDANRTQLNDHPDPDDPIAVQLGERYPKKRRLRFISDDAITCNEVPHKYLELRLGDERLTGPLPNPALRDVAGSDLLFQILKYRTQPFEP